MDKGTRFLVVDHVATMRRIVRNLLTDLGFNNVCEAADGNSALPLLRSGEVDFVITDWVMPGMSGIDLLRTIRGDETLANLPVLMVTAEASRAQIVEAAQAGVHGYIIKPFTAETLKQKLERIDRRLQAAA